MKKIGKIEIKKPFKFFILTLAILIGAYFFTALKESFSLFNVNKIQNQNYCTKQQDRFLFFYEECYGQAIAPDGSPTLFTYKVENGKVTLLDREKQETFLTLYYVKSGLYCKAQNTYYYPY